MCVHTISECKQLHESFVNCNNTQTIIHFNLSYLTKEWSKYQDLHCLLPLALVMVCLHWSKAKLTLLRCIEILKLKIQMGDYQCFILRVQERTAKANAKRNISSAVMNHAFQNAKCKIVGKFRFFPFVPCRQTVIIVSLYLWCIFLVAIPNLFP